MAAPSPAQIRRAGDRALLVEPHALRLDTLVDRLRATPLPGVEDLLPAARTLLITLSDGTDASAVERELERLLTDSSPAGIGGGAPDIVTIPVTYDGADLEDVARQLGITVEEVVARHTSAEWRCQFVGFTAGFGYLEAEGAGLTVPRRTQSRTAVPAGSVALADGYSSVYPRRAPGGWQLIGTTPMEMWDLSRPRPALLIPGTQVRFVEAGRVKAGQA